MESIINYQVCIHCGVSKSFENYYKHPEMKNGFLGKCKECCKISTKINYRKNIKHYIEYEKERQKSEERRLKKIDYQLKSRSKYPEKYKANCAVNNALRDGRLKKGFCELCGNEKTQAHHDDYAKPLEVKWLCQACHSHIHNKNISS